MKALSRMSAEELAGHAGLAIENTLASPEMLAAVVRYGYPDAELQRARALLRDLRTAMRRGVALSGRLEHASKEFDAAWTRFRDDVHLPLVALARVTFRKEPGTRKRLGIGGRQPRGYLSWQERALTFYEIALGSPEILARFAAKGATQSALESARDALRAVVELDGRREDAQGLARHATIERDRRAATLRDWLAEYRDTARIAFRDHPDRIERIGFLHRSSRRRRTSPRAWTPERRDVMEVTVMLADSPR